MLLVAINTAKWADAENEEQRQIFSILHNGHFNEKTAGKFEGVNVEADLFKKLNHTVGYHIAAEQDKEVYTAMVSFFTPEEREVIRREAIREEREKAKEVSRKFVINLYRSGVTDKVTIQKLTEIDDNELEQILSELTLEV